MLFSIWQERNSQLHNTQRIQDLEGLAPIQEAIRLEWSLGLGLLPASEFSHYFTIKLEDLLQKSFHSQRDWLTSIRQGRILLDERNLVKDRIYSSPILQKILDIQYDLSDKEALPILKVAITSEWTRGFGVYKGTSYYSLFQTNLESILAQNIHKQKSWFRLARTARLELDPNNVPNDEFSHCGLFQRWIGLV